MPDPMLTSTELAAYLGVHTNTVRRMVKRGELPCYRIGTRGDMRFRPSEVAAWLAARRGAPRVESGATETPAE